MSAKKPSIELVEHELAPGVFDLSQLPQFDESDAIVKRAYGNPGYFLDLDAKGSYDSAYWKVDHSLGDRNQRELLGYVVLGSIRTSTTHTLAIQAIDRLRETLDTNEAAQSALDIVLREVSEKDHHDRQSQARKMGEAIVERIDLYHLLVNSSRTGPDDYEIIGKFAHLRGLGLDEEGSGVPVVLGKSGALATLPSFQQTQLYFG